jgi:PAS domain S-box-containing protein
MWMDQPDDKGAKGRNFPSPKEIGTSTVNKRNVVGDGDERMRTSFGFADWPVRAKLAALLVAASLLPLVVWAYVDLRQDQARVLDGMKKVLEARGDQIVQELDGFHRGYRRSVDRLARFPDTAAYCAADQSQRAASREKMLGVLAVHPASDPGIRGAAVLDSSGHVVVATEPSFVGLDLSGRADVQAALDGNSYITDLFVSSPESGSIPTIAYFAPVPGGERRASCLAVLWVRASSFWSEVKASNALAGPGSFAVLFDHEGIRIAHTYSDGIVFHPGGALDPAIVERLVAERRFGDRTRALLEDVRSFPEQFERARAQAPDLGVFRGFAPVNQTWNYGVARRFETVPWTVFYMVPEADVVEEIAAATRVRVLSALGVIALASIAGLMLGAKILRPIRALGTAVESIAKGDLSARVYGLRSDEIGRLGSTFNEMAERVQAQTIELQHARNELDLRVQERTVQLQAEIAVRRLTEENLRESQQLLQAIIDNSAAIIYVKDLRGSYLLVNRCFSDLFQLRGAAVIGRSDHDLFRREQADAYRSVDERVATAGEPLVVEETVPHDDGVHTYLSVKCPLRDRNGHVCGVFGISTDITERKRAEDALRASEERLRLIVDTALDAVVTMDEEGVITGWSPQAETTFGWASAEAIGRSLSQTIVPERHRESHQRGLAHYLATGESVVLNKRVELTALHRDGREFAIDLSITPLLTGASPSFSAFVRDITERKLTQARLQAQVEHLTLLDQITRAIGERQDLQSIYQVAIRSLEERMPVDFSCICRYDAGTETLTVIRVGVKSQGLAMNLAMPEQALVAIDQNGLLRCTRGAFVYEPDIVASSSPFAQRLSNAGMRSLALAPLQSESRVFGILVTARLAPRSFSSDDCEFLRQLSAHVALAAQQAELHGALRQAYDDLRQTQQTVMQQERLRALGQMASGIAHDINNAISPVALYTESLLEREPNLSERGRGYLETIARAIDDVAATVARMREFYRPRETQSLLTAVNLNSLVRQVVDFTRARWSDMPLQRGVVIDLRTDLAADLPAISGIEGEVREALINLVFNAVDAMPAGGLLTLRTRSSGDGSNMATCVVAEVEDTGIGMDEQTRRRCVEPFFTTKGERGTGLGLAMVYGAMQRHGAEVEIVSEVGRGTTMRLKFPLPVSEPPAPGPFEHQEPTTRLRILLVDDDPLVLASLRDALEAEKHVVVAVHGGQAGIDAFNAASSSEECFDAVITDLGMPHVDGRKVAAAVKLTGEATPVILLTGWGQRLVADGEIPAHVDRVLSKPPKLSEVRAALAQLTSRRDRDSADAGQEVR